MNDAAVKVARPRAAGDDADPVKVLNPDGRGPFVITCEHASNRVVGVTATEADRKLLDDHWGWDIGAAFVVEALSRATDSPAVLSQFSRLIIDPNRDLHQAGLILVDTHDGPVSFNQDLSEVERALRIDRLWTPFHRAIDETVERRVGKGALRLVSVHSFTPVWLGHSRPMEVGVLFDEHHEQALIVEQGLRREGFEVSLNEPYSGRAGLIYSVARHGRKHGLPFIELEIRNDLIATREKAAAIAARIERALRVFVPPG